MSETGPLDRYTCLDAFRRLDDYVDHELTAEEAVLVRQHLDTCAMCAGEFDFEASVIEHVRAKVRRIAAPPDLLRRISGALRRADG